jgi:hypothetical protein
LAEEFGRERAKLVQEMDELQMEMTQSLARFTAERQAHQQEKADLADQMAKVASLHNNHVKSRQITSNHVKSRQITSRCTRRPDGQGSISAQQSRQITSNHKQMHEKAGWPR